jgi:hypothetical protein
LLDPEERTRENGSGGGGVPLHNLGGLIATGNNADPWDGSIQNPINVSELGGGPPGDNLVNTGTLSKEIRGTMVFWVIPPASVFGPGVSSFRRKSFPHDLPT